MIGADGETGERTTLEAQLLDWIDAFPVDTVRAELRRLEREKGALEESIEFLNEKLALWETARRSAERHRSPGASRHHVQITRPPT